MVMINQYTGCLSRSSELMIFGANPNLNGTAYYNVTVCVVPEFFTINFSKKYFIVITGEI